MDEKLELRESKAGLDDETTGESAASEDSVKNRRTEGRRTLFGRFAWYAARILLVTFAVIGPLAWYAYKTAQTPPEFYQTAITMPPDELEQAGKELESEVFELQNSSREAGAWQATFTQAQINGWLGSDLPEKFPQLLPGYIENPRVALSKASAKLAFRVTTRRFKGYVVAEGDAFCTDIPNQVAIRISEARAGITPVPIGVWADEIAKSLRNSSLPTEWTELDGDPVALIQLPDDLAGKDQQLLIEEIRLDDGTLTVAGKTSKIEAAKQ